MDSSNGQEKRAPRNSSTLRQTTIPSAFGVGTSSQGSQRRLSEEPLVETNAKRKYTTKEKDSQVNFTAEITIEDLTNPDESSEYYWQILAVKRQITLQEILGDNHKLRNIIDELQKELADHKQMLEEANKFVEVIKGVITCNNDDTGIDLNDVSTADDATEDHSRNDD